MNQPNTEVKVRQGLSIVLFNLFIVSAAGLLLRAFHYTSVPHINYSNLMEAHSHFAFGGWGFLALFIGFYYSFLNKNRINRKTYISIFLLALFAVWGMFFSFPFHGYAAVSTAFSTLYIWITYWFAYRIYKDTKTHKPGLSLKMARAALLFLALSSLGPYTMGALMAAGYGSDPRSMNAIYFYMHFQYNGWFIFGILALFFKWMERHKIKYPEKTALRFYRLLLWSCFPAFLLSVLWSEPPAFIFIVAGLAGLCQLAALFPLIRLLYKSRTGLKKCLKPVVYNTGIFIILVFGVKYLFQFLGAVPEIVAWSVALRNVVIGYLHLVFLGIFSLFMLSYFIEEQFLPSTKRTFIGLELFLAGFFVTEAFLFGQPVLSMFHISIPSFGAWMFYTSALFPLGAGILWVVNLKISSRIPSSESIQKPKEQSLSVDPISAAKSGHFMA